MTMTTTMMMTHWQCTEYQQNEKNASSR